MLSGGSKFLKHGTVMSPCSLNIGIERTIVRSKTSDYTPRQSRMMKKLMTGSNRPRKKWFNSDQHVSKALEEFSFISSPKGMYKKDKSVPAKPIRRVEVLNTIFMEYITGMMATGDVASQLVGLGIEVTQVKISNDFSCVNVYWAAKGTESDTAVEGILKKAAGQLRHECSKLRVIGVVPPIHFVKDKTFSKVMEVETLLAKCDFGDDFVPTSSALLFNQTPLPGSQKGLNTELTLKINSFTTDFNENPATTYGEYTDTSIENIQINFSDDTNMRQDILGLSRDRIMETITRGIKRKTEMLIAKEKHSHSENQVAREEGIEYKEMFTANELHTKVQEEKKRTEEFTNYLKQRRVLRAREIKALSTTAKEKEFYESEKELRWEESQKYDEDDYDEDETVNYEEEIQQTYEEYTNNRQNQL